MDDTFGEFDDATTAVAAAEKIKRTPRSHEDIVVLSLPRQPGLRRIYPVFDADGSSFYRVNFIDGAKITSFWVEVVGGEAIVTPELNRVFVPDPK